MGTIAAFTEVNSSIKAYVIFLVSFIMLLSLSLILTDGNLIYSLDDPYIHLALAENILKGHYGVNLSEFSSPSSSILWPFLLAPFQAIDEYAVTPLILNFFSALLTFKMILHWLHQWFHKESQAFIAGIIILLGSNMLGVIFTGMEHSLQILLSVSALHGMLLLQSDKSMPNWLLLVLIAGPLIRYENAIMSLVVGLYAMYKGYWRSIVISGILTLGVMLSYSLYLKSMGLDYLSASINLKSQPLATGFNLISVSAHFLRNSYTPGAQTFLIISILLFLAAKDKKQEKEDRAVAGLLFIATILQFFAGRFGWLGRYEIYLYLPCLVFTTKLYLPKITSIIESPLQHKRMVVLSFICFIPYLAILPATPFCMRDIYLQQYQMHRFVKNHYQQPVAVNDLGWVSYQNNQYVLDLWGLASQESQRLRKDMKTPDDNEWMETLTRQNNVSLAMIYNSSRWFASVPKGWEKIGELQLKHKPVMIRSNVVFYSTHTTDTDKIIKNLQTFEASLPQGTSFKFSDH